MNTFLKILKSAFIFLFLTILTQVGGIIYLLYQPFSFFIKKKNFTLWKSRGLRCGIFVLLYLFFSIFVIPPLAKKSGRVPLQFFTSNKNPIKCGNILLALSNRNYVKPKLESAFLQTARAVQKKYPGTQLIYLDANFPFWEGFPLLPHLSHDDGEKLDIAFLYKNKNTDKLHNETLSFLGYGFCEAPRKGEYDMPAECAKKGKWWYNFLWKITPQRKQQYFEFDEAANRFLLQQLSDNQSIRKILIEPHLKQRLNLAGKNKIRAAGCHAVRHDDHIHFQL